MAYVTSLAARRSAQLGGEHIHRLFGISTKKLPASALAKEALSKLENDIKRKYFLEKLQVLFVEEISLIHAELWATMDMMLQLLKQNDSPFGGVLIIGNGDCCQLPNVSGTDIFQSSSVIFNSHFHFLTNLVRMHDPQGQEVLKLLEARPVAPSSVERICSIIRENCNFHESWDKIDAQMIMKVFGKKAAERRAIDDHRSQIETSGLQFFISHATDEMCSSKSHVWRPADNSASAFLNKNSREPESLVLYDQAILRLTKNIENAAQGDLFIMDYQNSNSATLCLFKSPNAHAVTKECLQSGAFREWQKFTISKTTGFAFQTGDGSVRRVQFPFCNYVALTVHKLMGDTFGSLATSISATESKYSLWLTSQIYVIVSRVRTLSSLHFVGGVQQTLDAIKSVLLTKHLHEESIYNFVNNVKKKQSSATSTEIPCTLYLRHHFEVSVTENGFIYILISLADREFSTFYLSDTSINLSEELRRINSTKEKSLLDFQPWAMGVFFWNFPSLEIRKLALEKLRHCMAISKVGFNELTNKVKLILDEHFPFVFFCVSGCIVSTDSSLPNDIWCYILTSVFKICFM